MKTKPTYQELENQVAEYKKQVKSLRLNSTFQNEEKQNRVDELIIANKELVFQNQEKQKRADELIIANKELVFQNEEKQNRADELVIATEKAEKSENYLKEAQSIAYLGIYELDIASGKWVSSEILDKIFGIDTDYDKSVEGWESIIHPEWKKNMEDYLFQEVFGNRTKFHKEYKIIRKNDGAERWVLGIGNLELNADDQPITMIGTIQDITERKSIEKALKRSENVLNEAQKISKIGGWEYDVESLESYYSDEVFNIHGIPNNDVQLIVDGSLEFYHSDDREFVFESFTKAMIDGIPYDIEARFINARGEKMWVQTAGKPISKNGKIVRVLGTIMDITDRKFAEQTLKESEEKLRESNNVKDKFFSIIAHDLRSPFNSILGFSEILNNDFDEYDSATQKRFIGLIHNSVNRVFKLLDNLLLWSSFQRGVIVFNPEEINLYLFLVERIKLLNQSADDKSIKILSQITEDIFVNADRNMLSTIIRNLLSNAIKFTRKGGEIMITSRLISDKNNSEATEITISDNGVGIPSEIQSKLFDVGQDISTKGTDNETGTGLGLVLCKEFVEKHGGEIWIKSEIDKGSQFIFTIPIFK